MVTMVLRCTLYQELVCSDRGKAVIIPWSIRDLGFIGFRIRQQSRGSIDSTPCTIGHETEMFEQLDEKHMDLIAYASSFPIDDMIIYGIGVRWKRVMRRIYEVQILEWNGSEVTML